MIHRVETAILDIMKSRKLIKIYSFITLIHFKDTDTQIMVSIDFKFQNHVFRIDWSTSVEFVTQIQMMLSSAQSFKLLLNEKMEAFWQSLPPVETENVKKIHFIHFGWTFLKFWLWQYVANHYLNTYVKWQLKWS